jgi:tight adherence protein C
MSDGEFSVIVPVLAGASLLLAAMALRSKPDLLARALGIELATSRLGGRGLWIASLERIGRTAWLRRYIAEEALRRRLGLAGRPISIDGIIGLKFALATGAITGAVLAEALTGTAIVLALIAGPAAFRLPDLVLARMAGRRQQLISARVPDLVEVLLAASQAGLSPPLAFERAADVLTGPLGDELREAGRHRDLGLPWRKALDQLVQGTDVPALRRLGAALSRSHGLGVSVSASLRSVAEDLRGERRTRAEELARRAPVKMLFPMVFLILPSFLLLTVGPVLLATIRSLR